MSVGQMSGGVNFLTAGKQESAPDPTENEGERQRLADVVRKLQGKSVAWKDKYYDWTTENADAVHDPDKLSLMQLITLLTELGTDGEDIILAAAEDEEEAEPTAGGAAYQPPAQEGAGGTGLGAGGEPLEDEDDPDFQELVGRVKERQRQNPIWKEQWWAYVRRQGRPEKDPRKHTKDFLRRAIGDVDKEAEVAGTGAQISEFGQVRLPDIAGYFLEDLLVAAITHYDAYGGIQNVTQFITDFIQERAMGGPSRGRTWHHGPPPEKRFRSDFY